MEQNTNNKEDFPGYPHYPASDDITNKGQDIKDSSEEELVPEEPEDTVIAPEVADEEDQQSDVTPEDIRVLSAADQNRDLDDADLEAPLLDETDEDGEPLNEPGSAYGKSGTDLDIPGSELDDADEAIGEEDEENNYYSLGGDNHENLEEDAG